VEDTTTRFKLNGDQGYADCGQDEKTETPEEYCSCTLDPTP